MNDKFRSALSNPALYANLGVLSFLLAIVCVVLGEVNRHVSRPYEAIIGVIQIATLPVIVVGFLAVPVGILFLVRRWSVLDTRSRRTLVWVFALCAACLIAFILPAL
jgi:hypothetical protein